MTPQEQKIWNAVYASSFEREFDVSRKAVGYDRATEHINAELHVSVADLAVQRLREWRGAENDVAGVVVK